MLVPGFSAPVESGSFDPSEFKIVPVLFLEPLLCRLSYRPQGDPGGIEPPTCGLIGEVSETFAPDGEVLACRGLTHKRRARGGPSQDSHPGSRHGRCPRKPVQKTRTPALSDERYGTPDALCPHRVQFDSGELPSALCQLSYSPKSRAARTRTWNLSIRIRKEVTVVCRTGGDWICVMPEFMLPRVALSRRAITAPRGGDRT